ncbi:hypothetical protein HK096_001241, partial [Nowakowskiella sp. JEL0078]
MSAVNGATYILEHSIDTISYTPGNKVLVTSVDGTTFTSDWAIVSAGYLSKISPIVPVIVGRRKLSHAIFITDSPVNNLSSLQMTFFPPGTV